MLEFVNPSAVLGSMWLGWMIGAFYGFSLARDKPTVYPYSLWLVGLGFVVLLGVNVYLNGQGTWEFAVARAILWTIVCIFIPLGRWSRVRWEARRLTRKIRRLRGRG